MPEGLPKGTRTVGSWRHVIRTLMMKLACSPTGKALLFVAFSNGEQSVEPGHMLSSLQKWLSNAKEYTC